MLLVSFSQGHSFHKSIFVKVFKIKVLLWKIVDLIAYVGQHTTRVSELKGLMQ